MTDYAAQRSTMVENQLRTNDVTDRRVLAAMLAVPRERFLPEHLKPFAYIDRDLPLTAPNGAEPPRHLLEPVAFAKLLQLAAIAPDDRVLDVGAASGYSTAVIARLAESVTALESDATLARRAAETCAELGIGNADFVVGPLEEGVPDKAKFDVILLEGAVEVVPETLLGQLADGGCLVTVVGRGRAARAMLFERLPSGIAQRPDFDRAIAPLPGFSRPAAFVF